MKILTLLLIGLSMATLAHTQLTLNIPRALNISTPTFIYEITCARDGVPRAC